MPSEFNRAADRAPRPRPAVVPLPGTHANKPKPRITRSRIAKPLLTSLGTITMLGASTFVLLAVSSTGSAKPWDWTRADPGAAVSRYQACGQQGLGAIGCMLSAGFRPAAATAAASSTQRPQQPLFSVATVQDQAPAAAAGSTGTKAPAHSGTSSHRSTSTAVAGSHHLVNVPAGASMDDVVAACQAAMKTASTQGTAATTEVADECESDLASHCPAVKTPTTTSGTEALQEMEDECRASTSPSPSPSHTPDD